jgi:Fe2+ or Zn2+ uptake regulation protein
VSRATIYRALPLLLETGIIQATQVSKEGSYFEATFGREHHDHLICRGCGTVIEFQFRSVSNARAANRREIRIGIIPAYAGSTQDGASWES